MYPKSLWEKVGDLLARPGKRFLLGLLSCMVLGPFGVFIALSILEHEKTYFEGNVAVTMPSGETVRCALIKKKHFASMPVIPFVCLFFYIPYKTEYFLVKDLWCTDTPWGTRVYSAPLDVNLVRSEKITKAKAKAILQNAQVLAQELDGQAEQAQAAFLEKVKPYVETGLMKEVFSNPDRSIYTLEDMHVLFLHGEFDGRPCGKCIKETSVDAFKEDPTFYFKELLMTDPQRFANGLVILDDTLLERLLREQQKDNAPNEEPTAEESAEVVPATEPKEPVADEAAADVMATLEKNKTPLLRGTVEQHLKKVAVTPKQWGGWLLTIPALGCVELGIVSLFTGLIPMGIPFLAGGIWLWIVLVKILRKASRNEKNILSGRYRVVKTTCVSTDRNAQETDSGTVVTYAATFADGGHLEKQKQPIGVKGDTVYVVYLEGCEQPLAVFNGVTYTPSAELVIENT